eukprot:CAMPEP_0175102640 /NCGR_PEP_ID=MMETSP0086_2-20121207/8574_1 /TAXON_ID=136419 /ORGANISM="Unknown Unknown, Strain D1" /LENGTH=393 /DNA_ID=CAMNT_0016377523 /DNA_START=6 /DNA_END=1187 /DNA_ORIENTATION=+
MELVAILNGEKKPLQLEAEATGSDLFRALANGFDVQNMIFKVVFKGKKITAQDTLASKGVKNKSKLMVIGTPSLVASAEEEKKVDSRVKSFEQEDAALAKHKAANKQATEGTQWGLLAQNTQYKFAKFGTVKRFEGQVPHPFAARRLLHSLAADPGISGVMKKYQLNVGMLEEMDPDDRLAAVEAKKRGGCLLGYNQNAGAVIYLRLRQPDSPAFRPYTDIIDTLLHELAHNLVGPHDVFFWRAFSQLKIDYLKIHVDRKKHPLTLPTPPTAPSFELAQDAVDCVNRVQANLMREASSNGALQPFERSGAAAAAQEVGLLAQAERAAALSSDKSATVQSAASAPQKREKLAAALESRLNSVRPPKPANGSAPTSVGSNDFNNPNSSGSSPPPT